MVHQSNHSICNINKCDLLLLEFVLEIIYLHCFLFCAVYPSSKPVLIRIPGKIIRPKVRRISTSLYIMWSWYEWAETQPHSPPKFMWIGNQSYTQAKLTASDQAECKNLHILPQNRRNSRDKATIHTRTRDWLPIFRRNARKLRFVPSNPNLCY